MAQNSEKRSIEEAMAAVTHGLTSLEPKDASLTAVVQACKALITEKRREGVSWEEIAAVFRAAGFAHANAANVRVAHQKSEPLKKVTKARRRIDNTQRKKATDAKTAIETENKVEITKVDNSTNGPRLLRDRWG
jgi:translation initiation factor 2B subunit (eIF-2B alpha/beta/delta family)